MLVLGVGALGASAAAWQRIAETLVGAAVGVAGNLLFPPRIPTGDAGRAIDGLAEALSDLLRRSAEAIEALVAEDQPVAPAAESWLDDARSITHHDVPRVGATLLQAEQGRRLNVRAVGTQDLGPGLRHGLESLEHSAVAVRSMYRALVDGTASGTWTHEEGGADVLRLLAATFEDLARAVDAFGDVVRLEAARAGQAETADFGALRAAVDGLAEARARMEDLVALGGEGDRQELLTTVLSTVKRLQRELDLEQRVRRQLQLRRPGRTWPSPLRPHPARRAPALFPEVAPDAETQRMPRIEEPLRNPPDDRDRREAEDR
jgi:hypothetical protein